MFALLRKAYEAVLVVVTLSLLVLLAVVVLYAVAALVAWAGWTIQEIFSGETLTSLRFVPLALVQSIVPVSAVLMIVSRLMLAPASWTRMIEAREAEADEIAAEIARAEQEQLKTGANREAS